LSGLRQNRTWRQARGHEKARIVLGVLSARIVARHVSPSPRTPKRVAGSSHMLNASLLSIIEEAGVAVLILTEGLEQDEFLASRLTRAETQRQVKAISECIGNLDPHILSTLVEVDWEGWHTVAGQLGTPDKSAEQDALWFAVRALVPATLMWLRFYRKEQPDVFDYRPGLSGSIGGQA
jgi:uncharacterized protein with HEPN domain